MKAYKKTTKDALKEKPVSGGKKKKIEKPWMVEYMITDPGKASTWWSKQKEPNVWHKDTWRKHVSVEDAIKNLEKDLRSWPSGNDHWYFKGKTFRLVSKEQTINLVINGQKITIDENS